MEYTTLKNVFTSNKFSFFSNGIYNLNLFSVRATNNTANSFNDIICVACYTEAGWMTCAFPMTTDPGVSYLEDTMGNSKGTAILPASTLDGSSQYKFSLGTHKRKYPALNQAEEFTLVRDCNKDGKQLTPEDMQELIYENKTDTGWFGINIHHASSIGVSKQIDNWSAGCQVVQSIHDWNKLMSIIKRSTDIYNSGKLTYTLFDEDNIIAAVDMDINEFYLSMNDNRY